MTALLPVPGLTEPVEPEPVRTEETLLPSGLRVIVVRRPTVPIVEVRLRIPFFSAQRSFRAPASLLSNSMLTGTAAYDRAGLAVALGELGADLSVGVDADRLLLASSVLATGLPALLRLYAEVLTEASYPEAEVSGERERLIERITISRSSAGTIAGEALAQRMAPSHPYGQTLPDTDEVAAVDAPELRALHTQRVLPAGATLVLVGDLSPDSALDAVQAALAGWTEPSTGREAVAQTPVPALRQLPLLVLDRPGSVQTAFRFGGVAVPRDDPRYPALQLANLAFGGYFSSRWVENIRERQGYSYSPRSYLDHAALASSFGLAADVATDVTAPAVLETLYELGRICLLPITGSELESVRQYAIGSLALSTSTQAGLASTISALAGCGLDVDWLTSHPRKLLQVTAEQVAGAAAEFLAPSKLVGVAVGDLDKISTPLARILEIE